MMALTRLARCLCLAGVALVPLAASGATGGLPASAKAVRPPRALADDLKPRIDTIIQPLFEQHRAVGIVVGVVRGNDRQVFAYGRVAEKVDRAPDGDTVFEIGSITKTFTAILLADMVERGLVKLDDPIRLYLPPDVKVPTRNGKEITFQHLATHTSGLPRMTGEWQSTWDAFATGNPYKGYHASHLYAFLARYELPRDIGAEQEYSNLGMGLLGHILARKAGMSYEELVVKRICDPLGMDSTRITLSDKLRSRLAKGYVAAGYPAVNWDFDVLAGCGAIRSTANDMLRYVAANLGLGKSPLRSAIDLSHKVRCKTDMDNEEQALGWIIRNAPDEHMKIIWHNGGTFGYRGYVGFVPDTRTGVVVLSNCFPADPDAVGLAVLKLLADPSQ